LTDFSNYAKSNLGFFRVKEVKDPNDAVKPKEESSPFSAFCF